MILSVNNITKSFVTEILLNQINFQINEQEKVAVVGINGAGKTTLFKLITKNLIPDSGEIIIPNQVTIGYLEQNTILQSDLSIYDEILSAKAHILQMETELSTIETEMGQVSHDEPSFEQLSNRYMALRDAYERQDGYSYKSRAKGVLKGLGFTDSEFDKKASILSGGQKTRLALAKILLSEPDLLLLDEPTNHLDIEAIEWLESFLRVYKGSIMIISHDRYFLDKIVSKVIEIENGNCKTYQGNYTFYIEHKMIDRDISEKHYENQQKEIKRQEEVITKLRSYNREKSIKRARSREKALAKIDRLDKPITLNDTMNLTLSPKIESGNDVLSVKGLKKSFTSKPLFENIDFEIKKGERVALIGKNGIGKTTLFKMITKHIDIKTGTVKLGANVHLGYYDQEQDLLHPNKQLMDEISDSYPDLTNGEIRNILAAFLFTKDDVFKQISSLSGGEKGRITLAKLMLSKANFLLLDEPTNHLDIISRKVLEKALNSYTGTIFFISHDRYFINQVATRVMELTQNSINNYTGNYDYYIQKRIEQSEVSESLQEVSPTPLKPNKEQWLQRKEEDSIKRKKERLLEKTETDIHQAEERIAKIDELFCLDDIYSDHEKIMQLEAEKVSLEEELSNLYIQWDELTEELF